MESEIIAIVGVLFLLVVVSSFLYAPAMLGSSGEKIKKFYEMYVDWVVVLIASLIALSVSATALMLYINDGDARNAYIAAALLVYMVKMALTLMDIPNVKNIWLIDTVSHLMDLTILTLLFLGIVRS